MTRGRRGTRADAERQARASRPYLFEGNPEDAWLAEQRERYITEALRTVGRWVPDPDWATVVGSLRDTLPQLFIAV